MPKLEEQLASVGSWR